MPAAAWATLAIAAVIIALTAVALIRVIGHLMAIKGTLGAVVGGVEVIAHQTRTVPASVDYVNAELKPVRDFCEAV
ncbi:MAG: hypothetical protein ABSG39_04255 [Acidimicrobiales bacterium]|jgi:uncharacterized protein YoxC